MYLNLIPHAKCRNYIISIHTHIIICCTHAKVKIILKKTGGRGQNVTTVLFVSENVDNFGWPL